MFQKKKNKPQPTKTPYELLTEKNDLYHSLAPSLEVQGVIHPTDCDGLMWNAIYQVATGHGGIEKWQGEPGEWFRKPKVERDAHGACFYRDEDGEPVDNGAKAQNSRDMFLGLFQWIWDRQDLGKAEDIASYGRNASPPWFMGDGMSFIIRESTTAFRPSFLGTFFTMIHELGGEDNAARHYPYTPSANVDGFKLHLMVLHTLIRGQMVGITDSELEKLEKAADKQPNNAFYVAVYHYFKDGDQTRATELLLDESLWPADRLPTSAERCSDYIYQRDDDRGEPDAHNWVPCPHENRTFPGTGLMFTYKIISNQLAPTR
jgi:hypothetical protein